MMSVVRAGLMALLCASLSACLSTNDDGVDCISHYEPVAKASSWGALKDAMLTYDERGRVTSVRTQDRGVDVGAGDERTMRVADLLDRKGRRLAQVDVWRTDGGGWRAGVWSQCID